MMHQPVNESRSTKVAVSVVTVTHAVCAQVFQSKDVPEKSTTPEEFIRMTKGITTATAKAVAAGNSAQQEHVIATANLSRKAISDMLTTCKVIIHPALPTPASHPLTDTTSLPYCRFARENMKAGQQGLV